MSDAASVYEWWRVFDLDSQRAALDAQALAMATAKEESMATRKALAVATKEFRKLPSEPSEEGAAQSKLVALGPLLKSYQGEIDRLTKRAKFSHAAFLGVYRALHEAPDPTTALSMSGGPVQGEGAGGAGGGAADGAADSRAELARLRTEYDAARQEWAQEGATLKKELAAYAEEFAGLKNQDLQVKRLEAALEEREEEVCCAAHPAARSPALRCCPACACGVVPMPRARSRARGLASSPAAVALA